MWGCFALLLSIDLMTWPVVFHLSASVHTSQFTPVLTLEESSPTTIFEAQKCAPPPPPPPPPHWSHHHICPSLLKALQTSSSSQPRHSGCGCGCDYASIVTDAFPCQLISRSREQEGEEYIDGLFRSSLWRQARTCKLS